MTANQLPVSSLDPDARENARAGYESAIQLWTYQGEMGWARFNIMLVVNSLIVATIGFMATGKGRLMLLSYWLPVVGLVLCGVWFIVVRREAEYSNYYVYSARELEEKYLSNVVRTVSRGGLFAEGTPVTIEVSGKARVFRMSRLARMMRVKTAASLIILVLAVVYLAIIFENLPHP